MDDNALGSYLRRQRESVTPEQVGLPTGGRRRTPGLRREELATLAGVSVDYLTRLEQGRDTNPSPQVLAALADTLLLEPDQRQLLFHMAAVNGASELCPTPAPPAEEVRPALAAVLDRLDPAPALVLNRLGAVLAATTGWTALAAPVGLAADGTGTTGPTNGSDADVNVVRWLFTDDRARSALPGWARQADDAVAALKAANQRDDHALRTFLDELAPDAGPELAERLGSGCTVGPRPSVVRVTHPAVGELRLLPEPLSGSDAGQVLVVALPADDATARALHRLVHAGSPTLRAVPG